MHLRVLGVMALLEAFRTIADVAVSGTERKYLRRLSFSPTASVSDHFEVLQETLAAVAEDTVPLAKAALRKLGATKEAARLGRLSKFRNVAAHPDVMLAHDAVAVMQRTCEGSTADGSSCGSSGHEDSGHLDLSYAV